MSELYRERLKTRGHSYMGREIALREAVELALDGSRFTPEQMQANLSELNAIADAEKISNEYLRILADRIFKEK